MTVVVMDRLISIVVILSDKPLGHRFKLTMVVIDNLTTVVTQFFERTLPSVGQHNNGSDSIGSLPLSSCK